MTDEALYSICIDAYVKFKTKETVNSIVKEINNKVDFEENWLKDIKIQQGFVSIADIEVAMESIRSLVKGFEYE